MNKQEKAVVNSALSILDSYLRTIELTANSSGVVKDYLRLKLERRERETFVVLFFDSAHQLIDSTEMFVGTVNQTSVYPREVAKHALAVNASAVVFAHNHPSGMTEPSRPDVAMTARLREALSLFDISVLDHIIVGKGATYSFAERGHIL